MERTLLRLCEKYHKYWSSLMYTGWAKDMCDKYGNDYKKVSERVDFIETQSFKYAVKIADCNKNR